MKGTIFVYILPDGSIDQGKLNYWDMPLCELVDVSLEVGLVVEVGEPSTAYRIVIIEEWESPTVGLVDLVVHRQLPNA